MPAIDLVFEGGGAKGMVFVGALEELLKDGVHTPGRLLGTSAGAITAVCLAAGLTPKEMLAALIEKDDGGKSVFESFLAMPGDFDQATIGASAIRKFLADANVRWLPDAFENKLDDWIVEALLVNPYGRHFFSFVERGGWFSADPFVTWLERKLDEGPEGGPLRGMGKLNLAQFFERTGVEMTLVASDTTSARMLMLNHNTAPDCPVVWAARMSMSLPLLWQEVIWKPEWGRYRAWDGGEGKLVDSDVTGHVIVDGGMLSNFPIVLFLAEGADVAAVVGPPQGARVLGLLIDEAVPVPDRPERPVGMRGIQWGELSAARRIQRLVSTATTAHDNMAIASFPRNVLRLPAGGYGTTQFDMTDAERTALLNAGRAAMRTFLAQQAGPQVMDASVLGEEPARELANRAASTILGR